MKERQEERRGEEEEGTKGGHAEKLEQRRCKRDLSRRQKCERGGEKKSAMKRKMRKGRRKRERESESWWV